MTERTKKQVTKTPTIWGRENPAARPALVPFSQEAIVEAVIAIADSQGLASISLRNVGSSTLNAGPMWPYGYISTKEGLLELMQTRPMGRRYPHMQQVIATGRFPMLAKIIRDATPPSADVVFDHGINRVIDGIMAWNEHLRA